MTPLLRAADALMTVLLWMIAGLGVLVTVVTGHGLSLLVALGAVGGAWCWWVRRR